MFEYIKNIIKDEFTVKKSLKLSYEEYCKKENEKKYITNIVINIVFYTIITNYYRAIRTSAPGISELKAIELIDEKILIENNLTYMSFEKYVDIVLTCVPDSYELFDLISHSLENIRSKYNLMLSLEKKSDQHQMQLSLPKLSFKIDMFSSKTSIDIFLEKLNYMYFNSDGAYNCLIILNQWQIGYYGRKFDILNSSISNISGRKGIMLSI